MELKEALDAVVNRTLRLEELLDLAYEKEQFPDIGASREFWKKVMEKQKQRKTAEK